MNGAAHAPSRSRHEWIRPPPRRKAALLAGLTVAVVLMFACVRSGSREVLLVQVGSQLVPCAGTGLMQCLLVNGVPFQDAIEGFDYEEGYIYRLRVEREDLYLNREQPPDLPRYRYRLIDVVNKEASLHLPDAQSSSIG